MCALSQQRTTFQDVSYDVPCCRVLVSTSIVLSRGKFREMTLAGRLRDVSVSNNISGS